MARVSAPSTSSSTTRIRREPIFPAGTSFDISCPMVIWAPCVRKRPPGHSKSSQPRLVRSVAHSPRIFCRTPNTGSPPGWDGLRERASPAEEAVELTSDDAVALTCGRFQTSAIEDGDTAAAVADQAGPLQGPRGLIGAATIHPKHLGEKLLGGPELIRAREVLRGQQPTTETLACRVELIAGARLGELDDQGMHVVQEELVERPAAIELPPEHIGLHSPRRARPLHHDSVGKRMRFENDGDTDDTLAADQADLDGRPILGLGEDGDDGRLREVRRLHGSARLVEDLAGLQRRGRQVGGDPRIFLARQTGQDAISDELYFLRPVGQDALLRRQMTFPRAMHRQAVGTAGYSILSRR